MRSRITGGIYQFNLRSSEEFESWNEKSSVIGDLQKKKKGEPKD